MPVHVRRFSALMVAASFAAAFALLLVVIFVLMFASGLPLDGDRRDRTHFGLRCGHPRRPLHPRPTRTLGRLRAVPVDRPPRCRNRLARSEGNGGPRMTCARGRSVVDPAGSMGQPGDRTARPQRRARRRSQSSASVVIGPPQPAWAACGGWHRQGRPGPDLPPGARPAPCRWRPPPSSMPCPDGGRHGRRSA